MSPLKVGGAIGAVALAVGLVTLVPAAWANHGKAGLWRVTVHMDMPNMPPPSPEVRAQMKKMGVTMNADNTLTTEHCMTQADVEADRPPQMVQAGCTVKNMNSSEKKFTADMVCEKGDMKGSGHITANYDSPAHYTGQMTFDGTTGGQPAHVENSFEGKWISASCGTTTH